MEIAQGSTYLHETDSMTQVFAFALIGRLLYTTIRVVLSKALTSGSLIKSLATYGVSLSRDSGTDILEADWVVSQIFGPLVQIAHARPYS